MLMGWWEESEATAQGMLHISLACTCLVSRSQRHFFFPQTGFVATIVVFLLAQTHLLHGMLT